MNEKQEDQKFWIPFLKFTNGHPLERRKGDKKSHFFSSPKNQWDQNFWLFSSQMGIFRTKNKGGGWDILGRDQTFWVPFGFDFSNGQYFEQNKQVWAKIEFLVQK